MIVTIDGPAGAGKSTVAKALARRLGFDFLDTGAMYRLVTFAALRNGIDLHDEKMLEPWLATLQIDVAEGVPRLAGVAVGDEIRTPEVTQHSRAAADSPVVRRYLGRLQREYARGRDIVTEGRDQGTAVFPHAECKFFLQASPETRARRRLQELLARGEASSFEDVLQAQFERDAHDADRPIGPMVPAADAITIDSTYLDAEQVVDLLERHVRSRIRSPQSQ